MNLRVPVVCLVVAGILLCTSVPAVAQQPEGMDSATAAMMAKWEESQALGEPHKRFQEMVGKWSVTSTFWFTPDAPPNTSQGTAEFKTIFGGRYLVQDFTGDFMGETFTGMGISAYDNFRKEYIDIWFDDTGTGIYVSRGHMDESGKVLTMTGTMDDPMTDRKDVPARSVATEIDADTLKFEMYAVDLSGKEFKSMEMVYKRQK